MTKIQTIYFGEQDLLSKVPVKGSDGLFIGRINTPIGIKIGIIEKDNSEVIPFGEIYELLGIKMLAPFIAVVDKTGPLFYPGVWINTKGSVLCIKGRLNEELAEHFFSVYDSNAAFFNIDDTNLAGASFDGSHQEGPVYAFTFNYKTGAARSRFFDYELYERGDVAAYLNKEVSPETALSRRLKGKI